MRAATAAAVVKAAKKDAVRSARSRAARICPRIRSRLGASGAPRRISRITNVAPEATWATTFAIADPSMPRPTPCTSTSDRQMLARLAMPSTANGVRVSWKPRIHPWPAAVTSTNGAPSVAMRSQISACS